MRGGRWAGVLVPACVAAALAVHGGLGLRALADVGPTRAPTVAMSTAGAALLPGGPPLVEKALIGGEGTAPVRLYLRALVSRGPGSGPTCTAPDPAAALRVSVLAGNLEVFRGSLAGLAAEHGAMATSLGLPRGVRRVEFLVSLGAGAGDAYMGCASQASFGWFQG